MTAARRSPRLLDVPVAFAIDGTVLVSVARLEQSRDLRRVLRRALEEGGAVFVGVAATRREADRVLAGLVDGTTDAASHVVGARRGRRSHTRGRAK